jgi:hypothetical protein
MADGFDGFAADGNGSFLVAFAEDDDEPGVEVELFQPDLGKLGEAKAGSVSQFEDGLIAEGCRGDGLYGAQEGVDFRVAQGFGNAFPAPWQRELFRRVARQQALAFGEPIERTERGDFKVEAFLAEPAGSGPFPGSGGSAAFGDEERLQVLEVDRWPLMDSLGLCPADETAEQRRVSPLGVDGLAAFVAQMLQKILNETLHSPDFSCIHRVRPRLPPHATYPGLTIAEGRFGLRRPAKCAG